MTGPQILLDDPRQWLDRYGIEIGEENDEGWVSVNCVFHNDERASCGINLQTQRFKCHGCEAHGDIIDFLAGASGVGRATVIRHVESQLQGDIRGSLPQTLVTQYHRVLLQNKGIVEWLAKKGVSMRSILKHNLGWEGQRVAIPIPDRAGNVMNIRRHLPNPSRHSTKVVSVKLHGRARLFPLSALDGDPIVLTEGELKALCLEERGFNTITGTGGAGTWRSEWNAEFKGKTIYIIYDIDRKGIVSAQRRARELHVVAKEVHVVRLPISPSQYPTGDITDYFMEMGHTVADLRGLMDETDPWIVAPLMPELDEDETVYDVSLAEASLAKHYHKFIHTDVVVSAKDTAPYIVPATFIVRCTRDKDVCAICPVNNSPKDEVLAIDARNPAILKMVDVTNEQLSRVLRQVVGIPSSCTSNIFQTRDTRNVEEVRLIPQLRIAETDQEHVVQRAFHVGHGIETNAAFSIEARVVPEPRTQYATLLIYRADRAVDSLSAFNLTPKMRMDLKLFQPAEWTAVEVNKKLDEIYADLEANITRIYQRRDLHLFYDLIYHSVLYIPLQGKTIKGWVEGLVLGDSGQGKSEAITCLLKHYQLGEKVDAKSASVAGLIGGLQDTGKRWFITWGVITLNDRRLVVLEEVKGMPPEVIARMTEVRSSGIAEVAKIEKMRANARTRLIWISNPRSDQLLSSYNFGVEAVRELIGNPEDIRRLDMAVLVGSGDVPRNVLNVRDEDRPRIEHRYTSEICKDLVLWAWSRKLEDVVLPTETVNAILDVANQMGEVYSSQIPLVESADHRLKVTRLAAALAARTFSTDDSVRLIVRPCHVKCVEEFLDRVYSAQACGYRDFSVRITAQNTLHNPDDVRAYIIQLPHAQTCVQNFLNSSRFTVQDIMDWTEQERDEAKRVLGFLVRNNGIMREKGLYQKLPQFIHLLKTLEFEKLHDRAPGEGEEF